MRHIGPLLFILALCASTMYAQDHQTNQASSLPVATTTHSSATASTPANPEPWRIIPTATVASKPGAQSWDENLSLTPGVLTPRALANPEVANSVSGTTCFYIRSYLVARDSKDSDSTHLVGVSTCQPSRQYSLKTTDLHPHPLQR